MNRLLTAALALGLVTIWMLGLAYNGPAWLVWPDAAAALVALSATGMVDSDNAAGISTWPLLGVTLVALWLFGLQVGAGWLAWLNLVMGCGFLALTGVALTSVPALRASRLARRSSRRRDVHAAA